MLQQDEPDDYVIATGEQHSVREFVQRAFEELGATVEFEGEGVDEVGARRGRGPGRPRARVRGPRRLQRPRRDARLHAGRRRRQRRPALLPADRGAEPAGRPVQGARRLGWRPQSPSPSWCTRWCARTSTTPCARTSCARRASSCANRGSRFRCLRSPAEQPDEPRPGNGAASESRHRNRCRRFHRLSSHISRTVCADRRPTDHRDRRLHRLNATLPTVAGREPGNRLWAVIRPGRVGFPCAPPLHIAWTLVS